MIPEGLRYGFSIGIGYTEEKLSEKLGQKSRKMTDFARMWSRKILEQNRLVPRAAFAKLTQKSARICSETLFLRVFKEISGQIFSSFSGGRGYKIDARITTA